MYVNFVGLYQCATAMSDHHYRIENNLTSVDRTDCTMPCRFLGYMGPKGRADLYFCSFQPNTSLLGKTTDQLVYRMVCLLTPSLLVCILPAPEGWPAWVNLGSWFKMVQTHLKPANGHPSHYWPGLTWVNYIDRDQRTSATSNHHQKDMTCIEWL